VLRIPAAVLCAASLAACSRTAPSVPVLATAADIRRLAGEWVGEYGSPETGRSGSIVFTLDSAEDHAHGDVLMGPPVRNWSAFNDRTMEPMGSVAREGAEVLTIRFVRAADDQVSGVLDPYQDPSCACTVRTEFVGRLAGDTLSGTYETRRATGGSATAGRWRVVRSRH
jgi:hypothetical protein